MRDLKEEKQKPRNRTRSSESAEFTARLIGQFPAENGHRYIIRRVQAQPYLLLPVVERKVPQKVIKELSIVAVTFLNPVFMPKPFFALSTTLRHRSFMQNKRFF